MAGKILNDRLETSFDTMLKKGALPHSLLLSGGKHSDRSEFALKIAMSLNCLTTKGNSFSPCLSCKNCTRIAKKNFPDIIYLVPDGKNIKVASVRNLKSNIMLPPYEGGSRVIIVEEAELLEKHAGNAMLKMMEEPPLNTFFVLTAANSSNILTTIRSRCASFTLTDYSKAKNEDSILYKIAENDEEKEEADKLIKIIWLLFKKNFKSSIIFFISEYTSKKKLNKVFLFILLVFFKDIIKYKLTGIGDKALLDQSLMNKFISIKEKKLFRIEEEIISSIEKQKTNINQKLLTDSLLFRIQALIYE